MKNIKLLEALGTIDDELLQKAIETNDAQKLKELKLLERKKKSTMFVKYVSVLASSFAVLTIGIAMMNNKGIDNNMIEGNNGVSISNPISEVNSIEEIESYIGKSLEKYKIKEIEAMTKFNDDKIVQIYYKDDTSIRISKEANADNSGVSGAKIESTEIINNVEVKINKLEAEVLKQKFATWSDGEYSYTYYSNETENIIDVLEKIV